MGSLVTGKVRVGLETEREVLPGVADVPCEGSRRCAVDVAHELVEGSVAKGASLARWVGMDATALSKPQRPTRAPQRIVIRVLAARSALSPSGSPFGGKRLNLVCGVGRYSAPCR